MATLDRSWVSRIQKGDVLRSRSGRLRIVRQVNHTPIYYSGREGKLRTTVIFIIGHPSWTGRCYTVLTGNDLIQAGYQPTRAKAKLNKSFDRAIEAEFTECPSPPHIKIHARDVVGIP